MANLSYGINNEMNGTVENKEECTSCHLHCMERPRYFCGQLLTEEDLQAEQRYWIEKNKLHNRYLHGWGVVCGLEVVCHPKCSSKGNILIEKGYAIDCCGNDIILCKDEERNVFDMIEQSMPEPEEDECLKKAAGKNNDCKDSALREKKYCLIVKYKEEETRPTTALKRDDEGCSVKRCEPSRIKEGYTFEMKECRDCSDRKKGIGRDSAWAKMKNCLNLKMFNSFAQQIKDVREKGYNHNEMYKIFCSIKKYILDKAIAGGYMVHCDLKTYLNDIQFPAPPASVEIKGHAGDQYPFNLQPLVMQYWDPTIPFNMEKFYMDYKSGLIVLDPQTDYIVKVWDAFALVGAVWLQVFLNCICSNLLYPCPSCSEDDNVVLACVTVQGDTIKYICNLERKQVMSFPKLFYWFPINDVIQRWATMLCCDLDILKIVWNISKIASVPNRVSSYFSMSNAVFTSISDNIFRTMKTPEGFDLAGLDNRSAETAVEMLTHQQISVARTIDLDKIGDLEPKQATDMFRLDNILSIPLNVQPGAKVDLFLKDGKVLYAKPHEEVETVDKETLTALVNQLEQVRADVFTMKGTMRRDLTNTVKLKARIEAPYQPLAVNLVNNIMEKIPPEHIKELDAVRVKNLKEAGIMSVKEILEALPTDISTTANDTLANAVKFVDHAEKLTLTVSNTVFKELKKANVTDKKDLDKIDIKDLAAKLNLTQKALKNAFDKTRR